MDANETASLGIARRAEGPNTQGSRAATGVEGLDDILGGGLPSNRLYLLQGNPGTGKTTLALQFLRQGQSQGEIGLYITLAESEAELRSTAASHGWDANEFEIHEHLPDAQFSSETQHTLFHADEVDLSETVSALLQVVERVQPQRLVLDSLSELQLLAGSLLRYRREVLALKDYFASRQCTVLLLDDRTANGDDMQLRSLCHGVIMLDGLTPDYGAERRRLQVTKLRGLRFRSGWHDYTIETGGLNVFPRLVAAEYKDRAETGRMGSGLPALDAMLGGGLDQGTTTLLVGPAGTGKSSMGTSFALAAAKRGEKAVMYLFDERPATLFSRSESIGLGLQDYASSGQIIIKPIDAAEMTAGEFTHLVRNAVEKEGVRIIVLDSLAGYLHAMPGSRELLLHLHELLTYLGQQGVTTLIVVTQHGMMGSVMAGDVDVSYLADNVLLFRHYEFAGEVRKALSVLKRRSGPHENTIRGLYFDPEKGMTLTEPLRTFRGVLTGVPVYDETLLAVLENLKAESVSEEPA